MHSYTSIITSHLGTLEVHRVDVKHVMAGSNPKMVNGGCIQKMEGLPGVHARTGDDAKPVQDYKLTN
jgi:hypothetical protein